METKIIPVRLEVLNRSNLTTIERRLRDGAVAVLPTDTIYGLHCVAGNAPAVSRIRDLKARNDSKGFLLLIPGMKYLLDHGFDIPPIAQRLMDKLWPGPLTLVLSAPPEFSQQMIDGRTTVAVRYPGFPMLTKILGDLNQPLISTSANRSGEPSLCHIRDIVNAFDGKVDMIVDSGELPQTKPSTLVQVSQDGDVTVLREGAIPTAFIQNVVQQG